ncbi:MAG: DNA-processing protein DprA [Planctomycetes bacterium]|nr:DNA-processing protein DprA [Planctomycetota bacterium]
MPATATLHISDPLFPANLKDTLGAHAPSDISLLGERKLLSTRKLALFCSRKCPGDIILKTYDFAVALREAGVTVVSGFHSPMEKECLSILLRGTQPIIICPARSIDKMRVPSEWRGAIEKGRLLVLSAFEKGQDRIAKHLARERNRFVVALAETIAIAHAQPGGQTEELAQLALSWGKPMYTFKSPQNSNLINLGALTGGLEGILQELRQEQTGTDS